MVTPGDQKVSGSIRSQGDDTMPDQQPPNDPWGAGPAGPGPGGPGARDPQRQAPGDQGLFGGQNPQAGGQPSGGPEHLDPGATVTTPSAPTGGRTALIAGGAAAAVLLVGGGVYAYSLTGDDSTAGPDCLIPASAALYLQVDTNPSASQKVDAFKIARKFPSLKAPTDHEDLRRWLVEAASGQDSTAEAEWKKIEEWIGDRAAIAIMPGGSDSATAVPLAVLQADDAGAAEAYWKKEAAKQKETEGTDLDYLVSDGWVYVQPEASETKVRTLVEEAKKSSLLDSRTYRDDLENLGEKGIFTGWLDIAKLAPLLGSLGDGSTAGYGNTEQLQQLVDQGIAGHGAYALRFDGDAVELVSKMRDVKPSTSLGGSVDVAKLPADTLAAVGVAGAGKTVATIWQQALLGQAGGQDPTQMLDQFKQMYGLSLPDDLEALMGTSFTLAVGASGNVASPEIGARVLTDASDVAGPLAAISNLTARSGVTLQHTTIDGGYTVATTSGYAKKLGTAGDLGSSDRFKKAVPDAEGAGIVAYVDVPGFLEKYGDALAEGAPLPEELSKFDAIGLSSTAKDNGESSFSLRLTTR